MKKTLTFLLAVVTALAVSGAAPAEDGTPFPAAHSGDVFVIAQTIDASGALSNYYAPGSTVTFRSYAVDGKTHKVLNQKDVTYYYVTIPGQPNVKLKQTNTPPAIGRYTWVGSWTIPTDYQLGQVAIKVLVKAKSKRTGSFVQVPVGSTVLTISKTPQSSPGAGPTSAPPAAKSRVDLALYVDTVNGSRPTGASPRPIGCTQTNVYRRGEQVVVRTWGFDLKSGAVLTMDNVVDAHFSIAGQPDVALAWGGHGTAPSRVWFWAMFWNIPATYPLGDTTIRVTYRLTNGTVGTVDHQLTIIP
jgi:hypothetical protein